MSQGVWEIKFIEVGLCKLTWIKLVTQLPTEAIIARLAEPKLMSRGVDAVFSERDPDIGTILVGGWRPVGNFQVRKLS